MDPKILPRRTPSPALEAPPPSADTPKSEPVLAKNDRVEPAPSENSVEAELRVTAESYPILRRMDRNRDGVIEPKEAQKALEKAGPSNVLKERERLSDADKAVLQKLGTAPVGVTFGEDDRAVGKGDGQVSWDAARDALYESNADEPAVLGTVGQGRPGAIRNDDCGPTGALFMHDLRMRRTGQEPPLRTHKETDALIDSVWGNGGTTGPQMKNVMNKHFKRAGADEYRFQSHRVDDGGLHDAIEKGLASDPGGVLVPTISTFNESSSVGTRHWLVVTGVQGDDAYFYDPGGMDGANHLSKAKVSDLEDWMPAASGFIGNQVVYGEKVPNHERVGELPAGHRFGELEVLGLNTDLFVKAPRGVFPSREDAAQQARAVASGSDEDAIVRAEGNLFAVYGVEEIADQHGGWGSDNEVVDLDPSIVDLVQ